MIWFAPKVVGLSARHRGGDVESFVHGFVCGHSFYSW